MRHITKKLLITLSIIMLTVTTSFSATIYNDTVISITPIQLKQTNLIFAEHQKLLKENKLLLKQLNNYKNDNALLIKADSLRCMQVEAYKNLSVSKKRTLLYWQVGGITVSTTLLLLFLFK